jgi:Flp pilus assembly protein TadD
VVNPSCLKDLDCVSVCPNEAVHFGFSRPKLFTSWKRGAPHKPYDFSMGEEFLMLAVFLGTIFVFRGLYDKVPFLMTLGIGVILAYLVVLALRLPRAEALRFGRHQLKQANRLTASGKVFAAAALVVVIFVGHSAFIRYHEFTGHRAFSDFLSTARAGSVEPDAAELTGALGHLETVDQWGFYRSEVLNSRLATLHLMSGAADRAEPYLDRMLESDPAAAHELIADVRSNQGDHLTAVAEYRAALQADDKRISSHLALAALLANQGDQAEAIRHLETAVELRSDSHRAHYNLAVMLAQQDRTDEAIQHYETASGLSPRDPEIHNNLGILLAQRGETTQAEERYRRAIELDPGFAHPYFNLGRLLLQDGRATEAEEQFRAAARLDPAYANMLRELGISL